MSENPYLDIIPLFFNEIDQRIHVLEELDLMMNNFISSLSEIHSRLLNINEKSTEQVNSSHLSHISISTQAWLVEYVSTPSGFSKFIGRLKSNIVTPLVKYKTDVIAQQRFYKNKFELCEKELETEENHYSELYSDYTKLCETLDKETDLSKVDELKQKCVKMERECISFCKTLETKRRNYCLNVESIFVEYELNESRYYKMICQIATDLSTIINGLSSFYSNIAAEGIKVLQSLNAIKDSTERKSATINGGFTPIDISFNIFDYIDYNTIFRDTLSAKTYIVKEPVNESFNFGFKLQKNEVVELIEKHSSISVVESSITGLRGDVPTELLIESPFQRYICQLQSNFEYQKRYFGAKNYFCVVFEEGDSVICKTSSKSFVTLPKSIIKHV